MKPPQIASVLAASIKYFLFVFTIDFSSSKILKINGVLQSYDLTFLGTQNKQIDQMRFPCYKF